MKVLQQEKFTQMQNLSNVKNWSNVPVKYKNFYWKQMLILYFYFQVFGLEKKNGHVMLSSWSRYSSM